MIPEMSDFVEYKPMDVEHNVKAAVENLRKAYRSNDTEKVAKIFTEAEGIIVSAICHDTYTVGKPVDTSGDLISRNDALKAVDTRHEELLHDTEYRRKHCQIDLLGIKKHILAIPPANILKPANDDLISREYVESIVRAEVVDLQDGTEEWRSCVNDTCENILIKVHNAPTVEPQEKGLLSIDDVMSVFDDFMCNEVDDDGTEIFLGMLKDKAKVVRNNVM